LRIRIFGDVIERVNILLKQHNKEHFDLHTANDTLLLTCLHKN